MTSPSNKKEPVLVQWILDTRPWYPEATQTKQLETHVSPFTHPNCFIPSY